MTTDELKAELIGLDWDELVELFADSLAEVNHRDPDPDLGLDDDDLHEPVDVDIVKLRDTLRAMVGHWYREQSRKTHPDHGGSTQAQAVINECREAFLEIIGRLDFPSSLPPSQAAAWSRSRASGGDGFAR